MLRLKKKNKPFLITENIRHLEELRKEDKRKIEKLTIDTRSQNVFQELNEELRITKGREFIILYPFYKIKTI